MEIENKTEYVVQRKLPQSNLWRNMIPEFEDEDEARDAFNYIMTDDDDGVHDNCTFRIIKTTCTVCVVDEKVREVT